MAGTSRPGAKPVAETELPDDGGIVEDGTAAVVDRCGVLVAGGGLAISVDEVVTSAGRHGLPGSPANPPRGDRELAVGVGTGEVQLAVEGEPVPLAGLT